MKKIILFIASLLFLLNLISANGLFLNNSNIIISNKTVGTDMQIALILQNQEVYNFVNVSLSDSSNIKMSNFDILSGQTIQVIANITTNINVNTQIRIKGYYLSNVGMLNRTFDVNVSAFQSDPCDMSIIRGDKIVFKNNLNAQIIMKKQSDNSIIISLAPNETYTRNFMTPENFNYYFSYSGFAFPQVCHITALSDNGYVNNPLLDAILNLNVSVNYAPTTITSNILVTNYTINLATPQDGAMTITNTGSNIAKNIHLSGEWFNSFSSNNFDLAPGVSKGVIYTITPIVGENETNKSYVKTLSITGNFQTVNSNFNIFVPYAAFDANSTQSAVNLITVICQLHPELCTGTQTIVYKYLNNYTQEQNVTITAEMWRDYWLRQYENDNKMTTTENVMKDTSSKTENHISELNANFSKFVNQYVQDKKAQEDSDNGLYVFILIIGSIIAVAILCIIIYILIIKKQQEQLNKF